MSLRPCSAEPRYSQLSQHHRQHVPSTAECLQAEPESASPTSFRALAHPSCQRHPTVGSTSSSALGITSWLVHALIKQQFRAEFTTLPMARCNPAQENPVCQPLAQLGCKRNTRTRLRSGAPGLLLPANTQGQATPCCECREPKRSFHCTAHR